MQRSLSLRILAVAAVLPVSLAQAQVDDFEGGANPNGWSFGVTTGDVLEPSGGNPGGYLRNPLIDSFAPILRSGNAAGAPWVGDLRAAGVRRITLDAITHSVTITADGRNMALLLRDTKGTASVDDDDFAFTLGGAVPRPGQGWRSFAFDVPSASTDPVPPGWNGAWVGDFSAFRPGVTWSDVITSVDVVEVWWIDPTFFAILQQWDVGVDNLAIEVGDPGQNYCGPAVPNSSGASGVLSATGSDVVAADDLTLHASSLPQNAFGIFAVSRTTGFVPGAGGSAGNLCLGGTIGRYVGPGQILNAGPAGAFSLALDLGRTPQGSGFVAVQPGESWSFQAWHRDVVGGAATSNFTDGITIVFR